MPASHQYYKMINAKDGDYYRRWATVFGTNMVVLIDTILKASRHEQQAYNSCAGILHSCKDIPRHYAEEAAQKCVEMKSCQYSSFRKALSATLEAHKSGGHISAGKMPEHNNIRGKEHYSLNNKGGGRNE
jgi:protein-arginine kinase activator protein McsA